MTPTVNQFESFQNIFSYFNAELFKGELPEVILNFSRKKKSVQGYFSWDRWAGMDGKMHEISLNPDASHALDLKEVFQTMVHEMYHLWQHVHGKKTRPGYHDKQWGAKMKEVGLYPSDTGQEGGKETGQRMADYAIRGGGI